jgi:hypothetical protein
MTLEDKAANLSKKMIDFPANADNTNAENMLIIAMMDPDYRLRLDIYGVLDNEWTKSHQDEPILQPNELSEQKEENNMPALNDRKPEKPGKIHSLDLISRVANIAGQTIIIDKSLNN